MALFLAFTSARAAPLAGLGTVPYSLEASFSNPATAAWFTRWRFEGTNALGSELWQVAFGLKGFTGYIYWSRELEGFGLAAGASKNSLAFGLAASSERRDSIFALSLSGGLAAQGRVRGFGRLSAGVSLLGALEEPFWEVQLAAVTGYSFPFILFLKFKRPFDGGDWEPAGGVDLSYALTSFLDVSARAGYDEELALGGGLALPFAALDLSWTRSQTLLTLSFYNPWAF